MQGTGLGRLALSPEKPASDGFASCNNLGLCSGFFESGSSRGGGGGGGTCPAWGAEIEVQESPPQPRLRPAPTPPPGALYKLGPRARKESEYPSYPRPWFLHSVSWP